MITPSWGTASILNYFRQLGGSSKALPESFAHSLFSAPNNLYARVAHLEATHSELLQYLLFLITL